MKILQYYDRGQTVEIDHFPQKYMQYKNKKNSGKTETNKKYRKIQRKKKF